MVLSDPEARVETFRATCQHVLEESEQQEQLIDALLELAQGERGIDHPSAIDLGNVVGEVVERHESEAVAHGIRLDVSLAPARVSGDRHLIGRLVSNLLDNALRHNAPNGHARVLVETSADEARLVVANTGPPVPAGEVDRLLGPFQPLAQDRVGHRSGLGLGLSIVAAIASAHEAALDVGPGESGGAEDRGAEDRGALPFGTRGQWRYRGHRQPKPGSTRHQPLTRPITRLSGRETAASSV